MVEGFHRYLKAAIMCHPNFTWLQALPLVLLGLRSAFREELKASAAELVYGEPLRLPGELLSASSNPEGQEDATNLVTRLRHQMSRLRPSPAFRHIIDNSFVFQDLNNCSHVFLRDDTVRRSLQPPYSGPHLVVNRRDKTVTILLNGRESTVSIDRVKPAYILPATTAPAPHVNEDQRTQPTATHYTTRYGRRVRFREP
ncbi:uncharacterized protein LOC124157092 [Ischnura elegans]|uniref:uncharacterized protein LOC124157092 n=1 Tax=Ischnura elegans TaxID=197161 RepID=UPI001ED8830F|nr:uncharacterized protein LOC124157092 [Ischnura elegans]